MSFPRTYTAAWSGYAVSEICGVCGIRNFSTASSTVTETHSCSGPVLLTSCRAQGLSIVFVVEFTMRLRYMS